MNLALSPDPLYLPPTSRWVLHTVPMAESANPTSVRAKVAISQVRVRLPTV